MKKNLLTITMLVLCLVISISLVAVPAYAQEVFCEGTNQLEFEDDILGIEFSLKCEGERIWGIHAEGYIGDPGVVWPLYLAVCDFDEYYRSCVTIEEWSFTFSSKLGKREVKLEMDNGDTLKVEFKFKP